MQRHRAPAAAGFGLVMVLILLGALSLASAATLRLVSGTDKVATSFRMQALAQQAAEAALRHCEAQLLLPDAQRLPALQEASLALTTAVSPAWLQATGWVAGNLPSPPAEGWAAQGMPVVAPVCLVEKQPLDMGQIYLITARGFSPDWRGEAGTGATLGGSVVWLQASVLIHAGTLRDRNQRRIIQPPVR